MLEFKFIIIKYNLLCQIFIFKPLETWKTPKSFVFIINASHNVKYVYGVRYNQGQLILMLMFWSISTFFEIRLNNGGLSFMNALNNITKKICTCWKTDNSTFLITAEIDLHIIELTIVFLKLLYKIPL